MNTKKCRRCNGNKKYEVSINDAYITPEEATAYNDVCENQKGVHVKRGSGDWFICDGTHEIKCPYCDGTNS